MIKFLKKYINNYNYVLIILQISLIIGIAYQFFSLFNNYSLAFFSWTQVVNDNVILVFPVSVVLFIIWLGNKLGSFVTKLLKNLISNGLKTSKKIIKRIENNIGLFINLIIFIVLIFIELILNIFLVKETFIFSTILVLSYYFIILPLIIGTMIPNIIIHFKKLFIISNIFTLFFIIAVLWFSRSTGNKFITLISETRFNRLYVIKKDQEDWQKLKNNNLFGKSINLSGNKVIYFNDKYVFTENLVLNNDNSLMFYKK